MMEMYFNKNWYCSEFELTSRDLGFTTRFWIFTTELLGGDYMIPARRNEILSHFARILAVL